MSKRKEKRRDRAELVCKEIRKQLVDNGLVYDNQTILELISDWLKYGVKDSYNNK